MADPWFDQVGKGIQYETEISVAELVNKGFLTPVETTDEDRATACALQ